MSKIRAPLLPVVLFAVLVTRATFAEEARSDDATAGGFERPAATLDAGRYSSLAEAAAAAASARKTLVIRSRIAVRTGTVMIAVPLRFDDAGALDLSEGNGAVEIAGPLIAEPGRHIFFVGGGT